MLLMFAIALFIFWLTANFIIRITDGVIHILLIAALIIGVVWLYQQVRGPKG